MGSFAKIMVAIAAVAVAPYAVGGAAYADPMAKPASGPSASPSASPSTSPSASPSTSPSAQSASSTSPNAPPRYTATNQSNDPPPLTRTPSVQPYLVFDPPPPPVKSLRLEALRIAGERSEADWKFPEPEPIIGFMTDGSFYMGYPYLRPRNARSAALHGGAAASTLLGEILLGSGLPVAGVGAMLTGATLDSAAADVDRDAEARRKH